MIWKVLYDFERPHWNAYGHVLFLESETEPIDAARATAQAAEPDATITRLTVTPSTATARSRFEAQRMAQRTWLANVANGVTNDRRLL